MTGKDREQHGLEYYDGKPKEGGKDEGAKRNSGQPVLRNGNIKSDSGESGSDSSVANDLFGPVWDDTDLKDGVTERSERACEPVVENDTSECTYLIHFFQSSVHVH